VQKKIAQQKKLPDQSLPLQNQSCLISGMTGGSYIRNKEKNNAGDGT